MSKRKPKEIEFEITTKDGHWFREFTCRSDAEAIISTWAQEYRYFLVATRGTKKIFQKGEENSPFRIVVETNQYESRVKISAYVVAGKWPRILSLFFIRKITPLDPRGFLGVRFRRIACREINSLLLRMRQPPILQSESLHLADLDPSTLVFAFSAIGSMLLFLGHAAWNTEVTTGLSFSLLSISVKRWGILFGVALIGGFIHQMVTVSRVSHAVYRLSLAAVGSILFAVLSLGLMTFNRAELMSYRFTHHCVQNFSEIGCEMTWQKLSKKERLRLTDTIEKLHKQITY